MRIHIATQLGMLFGPDVIVSSSLIQMRYANFSVIMHVIQKVNCKYFLMCPQVRDVILGERMEMDAQNTCGSMLILLINRIIT